MTYKTILVHADAGPSSDRRVTLAAQLAKTFEADLIGVGAEALRNMILCGEPSVDAAVVQASANMAESDLETAAKRFRGIAAAAPSFRWIAQAAFPDEVILAHAAGADLIVTSRPAAGHGATIAPRVTELVLKSGTPVLVAADGEAALSGKSIIVAWKNTREARRAIADALPLVQRADKVTLVSVCHQSDVGSTLAQLREIADRLSRHGINAETEVVPKNGKDVAGGLEDAANRHGADLIVAGAYGRSHLQEWVLGGATEDLIVSSNKFVLLSH